MSTAPVTGGSSKPKSKKVGMIVGLTVSIFVVIVIALAWFCRHKARTRPNPNKSYTVNGDLTECPEENAALNQGNGSIGVYLNILFLL